MLWYISLRNYLREFTKRAKNFFHWSPLYWFLSPLKKNKIGRWTSGLKGLNKWEIFLPFHKLQRVKSLPFYWDILFFTSPPPPWPTLWKEWLWQALISYMAIPRGPFLTTKYEGQDSDRPLSRKLWFLQVPYLPIPTGLVVIQASCNSDRPLWVNANTETLCCNKNIRFWLGPSEYS